MKKNNPVWILAVSLLAILLVFNVVLFTEKNEYARELDLSGNNSTGILFWEKTETGGECPDAVGGSDAAFLKIKYFYSNFCLWCRKEEPILKRMVEKHGDWIQISWYNVNTCQDLVEKYKVSGVPTLIFSTTGNPAEYPHYGFTYEKDLEKLICDVTGSC